MGYTITPQNQPSSTSSSSCLILPWLDSPLPGFLGQLMEWPELPMRGQFGLVLQNRNDGINPWQTVSWQYNPQKMNSLLLLGMIAVIVMSGTVKAGNDSLVTVRDPTSGSLQTSYLTSSIYGPINWNRMRAFYAPSYNHYSEFYQWSLLPGCQLLCGPFSWPILVNGAILCQRNLSAYQMNNTENHPYKDYCVPDVKGSMFGCNSATYYLQNKLVGTTCNISVISVDPTYAQVSSTHPFDCCQNNNNIISFNVFADVNAVIV